MLVKFYTFQDIDAIFNGFLIKFLRNALFVSLLADNTGSIINRLLNISY